MLPIVIALGLCCVLYERLRPARPLPAVRGWWPRALLANAAQVGVVLLGGLAWDHWFSASVFDLSHWQPLSAGLVTYAVSTLIYYAWHRARHASPLLWRAAHQLHHSASRLEVFTAFYKHPLEMAANGVLTAAIAFGLLGVSLEAAAINTLLCAGAEFFYHLNVRTPYWLGFFIQRPEMHRVHHARGAHRFNYADLPVWDLLFGTFYNPRPGEEVDCGFEPELEANALPILLFRDVHAPAMPTPEPPADAPIHAPPKVTPRGRRLRRVGLGLLLALGLSHLAGSLLAEVWPAAGRPLAGLAQLTVAAPHPKVFTAVGPHEPFAFGFELEARADAATVRVPIDAARYARLPGPYLYRNPFGAALAFGPVLPPDLRDAVLRFGLCGADAPVRAVLDGASGAAGADWHTFVVRWQVRGQGPAVAPVTVRCGAEAV